MAVSAVAGLMSAASAGIAAAAAGTAFTIFGLTGLAAYATAFAIGAGLSMVSRALMPTPSLGQNLAGRSVTVRQPDVTRKIVYGQARVGGAIVYLVSTGPKNEYLHLVMTVAGHEIESFEEMWFNDDKVWDKDTGFADDYGTYVLFNQYLGNQTTVDPVLDAASAQWTSAHVLNGVAYAMVRLKYDVDQFAQGLPNISFVIKGKKVYNPITDVTEWTQNPALCVYDYLLDSRYGLAESPSNVNLAALTSAVSLCDQLVAESDNQIRYTLDGVVDSANSRKENIESMLSAMGGSLVYSGGQYFIAGSAYVAPTITIDESVMVGSITVSTRKSRRELYNGVKGVFLNAEENYTVADYPAQISSDYAIADGDPVYLDMGLAFTTNQVRAQRLAKLALLKSRQQTTINVPCNLAALKFKAGDNINVTNTRLGWTNKPFQILGYTLNADSDGSIVVDVSAIETSPELYDWQSSDEKDYLSAGEVYIYDGKTTVAPSSVTATPYTFLAADGTVESGLDVSFPESNDAFVEYYRVEWRTGAEDWQSITTKLTSVQIANLESNVLYDVRVIAVNQLKVDSAPTYTTATTAVDVTAPALPSNLSAVGGLKQIVVTWDNPADTDFKHVQVFAHTSNSIPATPVALVDSESFVLGNLAAGDVRYFWLKSVDFTGNVSAATASISATVAQAATSDIQDEAVTFDKIDVDSIFANTAVINSITSNAIDVATLNANNISSTTSLTVGTGDNVGVISGEDATYRIWAGNQAPASAPFSVDKSGNVILKNIYLSAGGIPLIDQFGFTQEALSQISATTQTEVNTVAKNFITEDGSQLMTLTTNQTTTVSLKYVRDGFSAVSTISGNQSYYEVPLNVTLSVKYRKDGGAWNTISQVLAKTASTIPTATQYQVETILNETPTGDRWYSQTVPSKGCINGANDVEYFLTNGLALDANSTYDFYLTLDATVDTTGSPDTIDSDVSDTSSKTLTVTVTSGSGFYVTDGTGSQGTTIDADTLGGQLPSYYASTSYVGTAISNLVDSSPATLDTLNELAAALGDDPNFATTVSNSIGTKWTQDNTKISNWDTAYGWGNHASAGYYLASNPNGYTDDQTAAEILTAIKTVDGASSGLDADTVDGIQGTNIREINSEYSGTVSSDGWYTIAEYGNGRAQGEFYIYDLDSSRHNYVKIDASWSFGNGGITCTANGKHGVLTIQHARLLYNTSDQTYGGCKLQIYCANAAWTLRVRQMPSQMSGWGAFTQVTPVLANSVTNFALYSQAHNLNLNGGFSTSGSSWYAGGNLVWNSGNDGSGSGLDADLLDGQQGSYYAPASHNHSGVYLPISGKAADSELLDGINSTSFVRSDTNTYLGSGHKWTFISGGAGTSFGANHYSMGVDIANGGWSGPHYSDLIIGYHTGIRIGAAYSGTRFYSNSPTTDTDNDGEGQGTETLLMTVGGHLTGGSGVAVSGTLSAANLKVGTWNSNNQVWHAGNDGSGSGLDADSLRGYIPTEGASANSIVKRDGNGHIYGNYILASYFNASAGNSENPTIGQIWTQSTGDNYLRKSTPAHFASQMSQYLVQTDGSNPAFIKVPSNYTGDLNSIVNAGVYFTEGTGAISNNPFGTSGSFLQFGDAGGSDVRLQFYAKSSLDRIAFRNQWGNGNWGGWHEFWTTQNDGAGSGLDADLLDGQQGSYYAPASHNHSGVYLPVSGKAADSELLDGIDSSAIVYGTNGFGTSYRTNAATMTNEKSGFFDVSSTGAPTTTWYSIVNMAHYGANHGHQIAGSFYSAGDLYNRNNSNTNLSAWAKIWNTANDGSGSGLDADLLDGIDSGSFARRDAGNTFTSENYFLSNRDTTSNSPPLQAYSTGNTGAIMSFHKGGHYAINMGLDSDNVFRIGGWSAATNRLQMDMSGNLTMAGNITAYSDMRLKENIEVIPDALAKVQQLRGVTFTRNDVEDLEKRHTGVIAQEVEAVLPEAVSEDNDGIKNVAYGNMVGLLIEAIKEQQTQINELIAQVKSLKEK